MRSDWPVNFPARQKKLGTLSAERKNSREAQVNTSRPLAIDHAGRLWSVAVRCDRKGREQTTYSVAQFQSLGSYSKSHCPRHICKSIVLTEQFRD